MKNPELIGRLEKTLSSFPKSPFLYIRVIWAQERHGVGNFWPVLIAQAKLFVLAINHVEQAEMKDNRRKENLGEASWTVVVHEAFMHLHVCMEDGDGNRGKI